MLSSRPAPTTSHPIRSRQQAFSLTHPPVEVVPSGQEGLPVDLRTGAKEERALGALVPADRQPHVNTHNPSLLTAGEPEGAADSPTTGGLT